MSFINPVMLILQGQAITTNAPHPNMAKLFCQWFASGDGQYAAAKTGRIPASPAIAATTLLAGVLPANVTVVGVCFDNMDYYDNPGNWSSKFTSIFG
jgi:ABC-type Fe3+ transport system substrate-binding protein